MVIIGAALFVSIIAVVITISQAPKWSKLSFEAVVQEIIAQPDDEVRMIVERITEVYTNRLNSLSISDSSELVDIVFSFGKTTFR